MKTLSFVLWMLLWWPLVCLSNYLVYLEGFTASDGIKEAGAVINLVIWIVVAILLYRKT